MKRTFIILFFCFYSFAVLSQNQYSIQGSIIDSSSNTMVENASISVLYAKDSILVDFDWTKENGSFAINDLSKGDFILLVVYHGFADYIEHFSLNSTDQSKNFGSIKLTLKSTLLEEVLIKKTIPILIKGDTTQFNATSYKIQPNDRVEDLLRQLPGIQIDQYGKITAHGRPVNKVLVDGEEFFGDDPTLVTKNIRADMIDKVQLFDKKSDQASFTGIDDGKKNKTLNITLKADKKEGYFGKVDGGTGSKEYYQGQAMFNSFKTKQKASVFGTIGNTNRTGLSAQNNKKYGNIVSKGDLLESFNGSYSGKGLPHAQTGGVHYDTKWNNDKESINLNYKVGSINVETVSSTLTLNNLPGATITSDYNENSDNAFFRQKLDAAYQIALNSTSNLKITADGTLSNNQTNIEYIAESTKDKNILNTQNRKVENSGQQKDFNMSALLTKKFKKPGKTASLSIKQSLNNNGTKGFLYSLNNFYGNSANIDSTLFVDQYKPTNSNYHYLNSNLTYSHPLSKSFSFILNYGISLNNSTLDLESFNQSTPGKYDVLDREFSSNFKQEMTTQNAGAVFNYAQKKTIVTLGARLSDINEQLLQLHKGEEYSRKYLNWSPLVTYQYAFSQQQSLYFNYSRASIQPTINQLQPIKVNSDPLNITVGNTSLRPSFNNTFSLVYNSFGLTGQGILFDSYFRIIENPIINNTVTDAAGKNFYNFINLKDKNESIYYFSIATSMKHEPSDIQINIDLSTSGNMSFNLSNNEMNKVQLREYSGTLSLAKSAIKKYDFRLEFTPGYNSNISSLQKGISNSGWFTKSTALINIYLPGKMKINSTANYLFQGRTETFHKTFDRLILNATLTKKILKTESLSLAFSGNDILNQNTGFSRRTSGTNMFTQSEFTTIRRYFMASIIWDFTKKKKSLTREL